MQHVLRCWERQSGGTEYTKTLRRPGLRPEPRLQRSRKPHLVEKGWLPLPKNPIPSIVGTSGLAFPAPTPKLVPTPLVLGQKSR